ncbi:MAG: DUF917 domain-containing protein, partial [Pseudomonadota bacterium]
SCAGRPAQRMSIVTLLSGKKRSKRQFSLSEADLHDFARGAALLGTGGGGDPYIGRLMAQNAIREFGEPRIVSVDDLPKDATVCIIAMLGAPTVLSEKGASGTDIDLAITRLSERIGKPIDAVMPAEIGGVNSTIPIVAAARLGLPLVNADGMGRAFPEIQMVTMTFEGVSATPFVIVDDHENSAIIETDNAKRAEDFVRAVAIQMGLSCMVAGYAMSGAEVRRATIPGTLTAAYEVGKAIADGRVGGDPINAVLGYLSASPIYGHARELFDGKVVDLRRETTRGFSIGHCTIEGLSDSSASISLQFQNEYLIALERGQMRAIVPDLIAILDRETAEPIPVEALRYGQRVKVIAAAAPAALRADKALEYVSPRCFGLDYDYAPIETL